MNGDIIEVDYAKTNNLSKGHIKKIFGYVSNKGGGSADGQSSGNPELTNKLPTKSKPNSKKTLYHNGKKIRERYYDKNGRAQKDIDYTDHGNPKEHPKVPHEHKWDWNNPNNPKRSKADD